MSKHGYGKALIRKIANGNWLKLLERTLGGEVPGGVRTP
jgi:microsomal dipeptidase-like Zn-dependent dipeptidase